MRNLLTTALAVLCFRAGAETLTTSGAASVSDSRTTVTFDRGCITRGPRNLKRIALEFTGGNYADGGTTILDTLKQREIKASFFFIGDFFRNPEFKPLIERVVREGHYVGPHSDRHPLYASWDKPPKLLISREDFDRDLLANMETLGQWGVHKDNARFFIPPYEHFTPEIVDWTNAHNMVLINYTSGARTHADYMEDTHKNFISSPDMVKSVLDYEKKDPDGLNGFLLLMHIGAGPGRTRDHLYNYLPGMLDDLIKKGYSFTRVDELLSPKGS